VTLRLAAKVVVVVVVKMMRVTAESV